MNRLSFGLSILLILLGVAFIFLKDYVQKDKYPSIKYVLPSVLIIMGVVQICIQIYGYCDAQRDKALKATSGNLGRTYIIESDKGIFPKLEIGNSGAIFVFGGIQTDNAVINAMEEIFKINGLKIYVENGIVTFSSIFRNPQGNIIAEVVQNEWKHKPLESDLIWDRNYSDNAIEVKDGKGRVVLQIRLLVNRIQLQGIFYNEDGRGCALYETYDPNHPGGLFRPNVTDDDFPVIKPIFKYPSSKYLGIYLDPSMSSEY